MELIKNNPTIATKAVLRGKSVVIQAYLKKQTKKRSNNLTLKPKGSRKRTNKTQVE